MTTLDGVAKKKQAEQSAEQQAAADPRSARLVASFAGFGRAARSQAAACALVARYRPGGSALRLSSREIVDGARLSRAAIDRIDSPAARASAISSRSAKDR